MNYADIKQYDIANGTGIRVSVFVSGCTHGCKGCFNKEAWDFEYGKPFTDDTVEFVMKCLEPDYYSGLTLLGGEPFEHSNQIGLLPLLRRFRKKYPREKYEEHHRNVWAFSGYTFETDILGDMCSKWPETKEMLSYIDILVDGEFHEDEKSLKLIFKGSANQRTIRVPESLESGKTILHEFPELY